MSDRSGDAEDGFDQVAAVRSAEAVVTHARLAQLEEAQLAARRRISAAKGLLTRAQRDGSADKILAARKRLDQRRAEFDGISGAVVAEAKQIYDHWADQNRDFLDQMGQRWPWRHEDTDGPDESTDSPDNGGEQ